MISSLEILPCAIALYPNKYIMVFAPSGYWCGSLLSTHIASERFVSMIVFGKMQFSLQRIIALGFALIILTGGLLLTII